MKNRFLAYAFWIFTALIIIFGSIQAVYGLNAVVNAIAEMWLQLIVCILFVLILFAWAIWLSTNQRGKRITWAQLPNTILFGGSVVVLAVAYGIGAYLQGYFWLGIGITAQFGTTVLLGCVIAALILLTIKYRITHIK